MIAAEERLRREIAEALHGRLQTRLLLAWLRLGECEPLLDRDPEAARAVLREVRDALDDIREREVRRLSHQLHPALLRIGLTPALHALADSLAQVMHVTVDIEPELARRDDPEHDEIPYDTRLAAYRAVEESLINAQRHGAATHASVVAALEDAVPDRPARLRVEVADDGHGFDVARTRWGLGLTSIATRVSHAGGWWHIESAAGGTRVSLRLPLERASGLRPRGRRARRPASG